MSAFAEVIGAPVYDDGSLPCGEMISNVVLPRSDEEKVVKKTSKGYTHAQNTLGPYQFNLFIGKGTYPVALFVGFEVPKIAYMALTIGWSTVRFRKRVDCVREGRESQQYFQGLASGGTEASYAKVPCAMLRFLSQR